MKTVDSALRNRTIVMHKQTIVETLKKNKEQHLKDYKEAVDIFNEVVLSTFSETRGFIVEKILQRVDSLIQSLKDQPTSPTDFVERAKVHNIEVIGGKHSGYVRISPSIDTNVLIPQSFVDAYDKAIQFIESDTREEIEMDYDFYRCVILDEWDWMEEFASNTLAYKSYGVAKLAK